MEATDLGLLEARYEVGWGCNQAGCRVSHMKQSIKFGVSGLVEGRVSKAHYAISRVF